MDSNRRYVGSHNNLIKTTLIFYSQVAAGKLLMEVRDIFVNLFNVCNNRQF